MPFTPTHIVAIVPIFYINRRLPLSALSIGAVIPDFPMFFPISTYEFSHSLLGLLLYCLPMALIVYLLFENIGKQFVIDMSPQWMRSRLGSYRQSIPNFSLGNMVMLSFAFTIGSVSHIVWDAFSHQSGWGVKLYPFLVQKITIVGFSLPYYKIIQYGSSVIGLPLLVALGGFYLLSIKPRHSMDKQYYSKTSVRMITISFLVIPIVIAFYHWNNGVSQTSTILGSIIKASIGVGIGLFFLYALLYWWYRRQANL